tara:strand:+ start:543264 stop:544568 length:1305 start_codon:yes stop_codon:yes gene_type:complete
MLAAPLIVKKREGFELNEDEIRFLINGFCDGSVADYQMSALAMAICLKGMNQTETAILTSAMLESGSRLPRREAERRQNGSDRPRVDKHSTGGLGDKVSLILAPLLAVCDVDVPMISGRGLGLTGGTLDKLEAIPGFRTDLSTEQSSAQLERIGAFIVSASEHIAPADRKLYALRDVTGTVESVALITASILSKKLAASLDALVMDVKVGAAAFMKTLDNARELAHSIVQVADRSGLPTTAILSDMDQPLGQSNGNANEVNESIAVLQGQGPQEVRELTVELCADLLIQAGVAKQDSAREMLNSKLDNGEAYERFEQMVAAQDGRMTHPLPVATPRCIESKTDGFVSSVNCLAIGEAVVAMGGGRRKMGDKIDPAVGVDVHVRIGQEVVKGQKLFTIFCDRYDSYSELRQPDQWIETTPTACGPRPLIIERITD